MKGGSRPPRGVAAAILEAISGASPSRAHEPEFLSPHEGCEVALYGGRGAEARAHLDAGWSALRRSLLLQVEAFRLQFAFLRGRVALANARADVTQRREVAACAEELESSGAPWARGWAWLLRGALAVLEGRRATAVTDLTRAVGARSAADMEIYAQVARLALARLQGDTTARDAAEAWIRAQRVANPAGVARMICPTP